MTRISRLNNEISCQNSDISVFEHVTDVNKTIKMTKGTEKNCRL